LTAHAQTIPLDNYLSEITNPIIQKVIECESQGLQHRADGSLVRGAAGEIGIAQFMPATWKWMEGEFYKENQIHLDINSAIDQLTLIQFAFNHHWQHHWSCYKKVVSTQKLSAKSF